MDKCLRRSNLMTRTRCKAPEVLPLSAKLSSTRWIWGSIFLTLCLLSDILPRIEGNHFSPTSEDIFSFPTMDFVCGISPKQITTRMSCSDRMPELEETLATTQSTLQIRKLKFKDIQLENERHKNRQVSCPIVLLHLSTPYTLELPKLNKL